jgi:uncharacterized protein (TIGR02266 family)
MADIKEKILIADDMETFLRLEKMLLERSGFEIIMAKSGGEAIKKVQTEKPKLVFMDMMMPDMNGDVVCRFIKTNKAIKHIPVIMVTTKSEPEFRERCMQAGCDDFITKPVTQRDLFEKIKKFIPVERRKHQRAHLRVIARSVGKSFTSENFTYDVSEGGVFVETPSLLPTGAALEIEFTIPGHPDRISASGVVARLTSPAQTAAGRPAGIAISFTDIAPADVEVIKNYIAQNP